jgi:Ca2+-binding RTX toxin-like protein
MVPTGQPSGQPAAGVAPLDPAVLEQVRAAVLDAVQSAKIVMGSGADTVTLSNYTIWVPGRSTTVQVTTGAGNDSITGWTQGNGILNVQAGDGNDTIIGSGGNDRLEGGAGNDVIDLKNGGYDAVVFTKGQGTTAGGFDEVMNFARNDVLVLKGFAKTDLVISDAWTGAWTGTLLTLPGEVIHLNGFHFFATSSDWAFSFQ